MTTLKGKTGKMKFAITAEKFRTMKVYQDIDNEVNGWVYHIDDKMLEFWEGEKVVDLIEKAKNGCVISCSKLAYCFEWEEQYEKSFVCFKKAGRLGDENACYIVGMTYLLGFFPWLSPSQEIEEAVNSDDKVGLKWLEKAAELNSVDAINYLRLMS